MAAVGARQLNTAATATGIASSSQWPLTHYPDAQPSQMSATQAQAATRMYLGTLDGVRPSAEDRLSYTDKTYLENFDQSKNNQINWWVRNNFEQADSSWHFVHAPIEYSETLEQTDYIVTVNKTMMDRTAAQGVPSFVSMEREKHLTKLKQYIKGLEIDGEAFFNSSEGNDTYWKYVAAVAQAALLTAKASIAAGILTVKDYWIEWRRKYGDTNHAQTAYQACETEIRLFGRYAYNKKALYQACDDAKTVGSSESVAYDMLVLPPGTRSKIAFSAFESDSAAVRGVGRQEQRLTRPTESFTNEFAGVTIYDDMIFDLHNQVPFSLTFVTTRIGRFFVLDGTRAAVTTPEKFDAHNDGRVGFVNIDANAWDEFSLSEADKHSISFDHNDAVGAVSADVQQFGAAVSAGWLRTANLRIDEEGTRYIHPYLWFDEQNASYHITRQNGERMLESAPLDHGVVHGRALRRHLAETGACTAEDQKAISRALSYLQTWFHVAPSLQVSAQLQGWYAAIALANQPGGGGATRGLAPRLNRAGGVDLPATRRRAGAASPYVLGVIDGSSGNFRAVVRKTSARGDGYVLSEALRENDEAPAESVTVPPAPFGYSTVPGLLTLAEFMRNNQSALGGYEGWKDRLEVLAQAYHPLAALHGALQRIYERCPSFQASNAPFYNIGAGSEHDYTMAAFAARNFDLDKQPLMVAFTPTAEGGVVGINAEEGAEEGDDFVAGTGTAGDLLTLFGFQGVGENDAEVISEDMARLNLLALLRAGVLDSDLAALVKAAQTDTLEGEAARRRLAAVWARYENSVMQESYVAMRTAQRPLSADETKALGRWRELLLQEANLGLEVGSGSARAFAAPARRDDFKGDANLISSLFNVLNSNGVVSPRLNDRQLRQLRSAGAHGARLDLPREAGSVVEQEKTIYVTLPLSVSAQSWQGASSAQAFSRLISQPASPQAPARPLVALNVLRGALGGGGREEGGGGGGEEFMEVEGGGGGAADAAAAFDAYVRAASQPRSWSDRGSGSTNRWLEERYAHAQKQSDFIERLGALLWMESPCDLEQRGRFRRANLPYDSNSAILQPDGEFDMAPDQFLIAGAGRLLYSMPSSLLDYDKIRNKMTVRATLWMAYRAARPTASLKFPHSHYVSYRGGFGHAGFYTQEDRAEYDPNELPTGERDSFVIDLGASVGDQTMPDFFSIQLAWSSKDFLQSFSQLEDSNYITGPLVNAIYASWYWKWNRRNSAQTPSRTTYAELRDTQSMNVAVGRCVQKNHIAGTAEWRQQRPARSMLKEIGPGCRQVMDGSGDMMPNEKDLPLFL